MNQLSKALALAAIQFENKTDKAGSPYFCIALE
jgi:hypothetical protein